MMKTVLLFLTYTTLTVFGAISNCEREVDGFCEICQKNYGVSWDGSKCLDNSKYVDKCMIYEDDDATCHTCICGYGLTLPANTCNIDLRTDAIEEKGCSTFDKDKKCTFCRSGFTLTVKGVCIPETDIFGLRGCAIMDTNNVDCFLCHQDWGLVADDGQGRKSCVDIPNDFEFENYEEAIWPNLQSIDSVSPGITCKKDYFFVSGYGCENLPQYCLSAYRDVVNDSFAFINCTKCNQDSILLQNQTCLIPDPEIYYQFDGCSVFSDDRKSCIKCPDQQILVQLPNQYFKCMDEISNCIEYVNLKFFCKKCAQFYTLSADGMNCWPNFYKNTPGCAKLKVHDNNQCQLCSDEHNFILAQNGVSCACKAGYFISASWPETCINTQQANIPTCTQYLSETRCIQCQDPTFLTFDKTNCLDPANVPNCQTLIYQDYCYSCKQGFGRLPNGTCLSYSEDQVIQNCYIFLNDAGDACRQCNQGYNIDQDGICQLIENNNGNSNSQKIVNCTQNYNQQTFQCISCDSGFQQFQTSDEILCSSNSLIENCTLYDYNETQDIFSCIQCSNDLENGIQRVPNIDRTICFSIVSEQEDYSHCTRVNDTNQEIPCIECEDYSLFSIGDFGLNKTTDLCINNENFVDNCLEYAEGDNSVNEICINCKPSYIQITNKNNQIVECRPSINNCIRQFPDTQNVNNKICSKCEQDRIFDQSFMTCNENCQNDFLNNLNGECFPAHPFCNIQPVLNYCLECEYPFGLINGQCRLLPPGCQKFAQSSEDCGECFNGFDFNENGDCQPIYNDNCLKLENSTHCKQCFNDSFGLLDNQTDCINTIDNCEIYIDETSCKKCNEDSILLNKICKVGCASLNNEKTKCIECNDAYTLVGTECLIESSNSKYKNCKIFNQQINVCQLCQDYYGLKQGVCIKDIVTNCIQYNINNMCELCAEGYTLANNYCFLNMGPCKIDMCVEYPIDFNEGNFQCSKCDPNFHIYKYLCKKGPPNNLAKLICNFLVIISLIVIFIFN